MEGHLPLDDLDGLSHTPLEISRYLDDSVGSLGSLGQCPEPREESYHQIREL